MSTPSLARVAVLVPAYQPDVHLERLVAALRTSFARIVVVDDGSTRGAEAFEAVARAGATVLHHPANRGKGAALKTGFGYILKSFPDLAGVVTADADGQHLPEDIARVAERLLDGRAGLVLGVRTLPASAPFRSLWGNWWTRQVFRLATGLAVSDTQTGLRGIPATLLARVAALPGDRYEYEMRMLADAARHPAPPVEVSIRTVYLDGNAASHFQPLRDTLRIFHALFGEAFRPTHRRA